MSSFGQKLLDDLDPIIERWYALWRSSERPHEELSEAAIKDRLPLQLRVIAEQIRDLSGAEATGEMWSIGRRLDPELRIIQDVPIEDVVDEYRMLVETVRLWIKERRLEPTFEEYSYFYDAVFELVAESVRRYATHQAERVSRDRAEYLSGLAHQMRGPLWNLLLRIRMLEQAESPVSAETLAALERDIGRLRLLVDGVMRLERFDPEELPLHPRPTRPARLIDDVVGDNEYDAGWKGLRLEVAVNHTLEVVIDPALFIDALGNLVQNAVKYTDRGYVRIEAREEDEAVVYRVEDSGPGIAPERRAQLFKPVAPGRAGGAGIGLTVAHRAVVAQGGTIGVESEPGKGAMFWFRLPRSVSPRREADPGVG